MTSGLEGVSEGQCHPSQALVGAVTTSASGSPAGWDALAGRPERVELDAGSADTGVAGHDHRGERPGGNGDLGRLRLAPSTGAWSRSGSLYAITAGFNHHRELAIRTGTSLSSHAALRAHELDVSRAGPGSALRIGRDALDRADGPEHHGALHPGARATGDGGG